MKKPAPARQGRADFRFWRALPAGGGGCGRGGVVVDRSVGSAALEGVEQHVAHRADVCLDPVEAVAIDLAIFAALLVGAVAFGDGKPPENMARPESVSEADEELRQSLRVKADERYRLRRRPGSAEAREPRRARA